MGAGGSPCGVARAGGFAGGPALATPQGLPTAPNMGGAEGGFAGSYNRRGICRMRPIEIHPVRGGGRAGRGNGGTVRHCSCLGHPEQGGGLQGAIIGGAFVVCTQSAGSPPPGGRAHGMGAGGSPCGVARAGGFAVGPALATPQGLPTAPNMGGAEGGQCAKKAFVPPNYGGEGG